MSIEGVYLEATKGRMVEGISVTVVSPVRITVTEEVARVVGPLLAADLFPDRRFGRVLHVEEIEGEWEVVVEDLGS